MTVSGVYILPRMTISGVYICAMHSIPESTQKIYGLDLLKRMVVLEISGKLAHINRTTGMPDLEILVIVAAPRKKNWIHACDLRGMVAGGLFCQNYSIY